MEDCRQNGKKICRLCLMKCDKYEVIESNIRNNMDILLLNINLLLSEEPTICKNCAEIVKKCFYFKTKCLDTYKCIVSCNGGKSNIKIDLKNIYLSKKECVTGFQLLDTVPEDCNICGFCMSLVKSRFTISLDNVEDNMLQKMFDTCFPELDFNIVKKPTICIPCHGHLQDYFRFMTNCLFVEQEIRKYCESMDIQNNKTLIDLPDVLQFMLRNKVTGGKDVNITEKNKKEKYRIHPEHFYEVGKYKNESVIEPMDQKFNNLLQCPLQNLSLDIIGEEGTKIELEGKSCDGSENIVDEHREIKRELETFITIEDHKLDNILFTSRSVSEELSVIKREENFVEEQIVQKNENYVGVEDQKYLLNDEIEIKTDSHDFSSFQSDSSKLVTSDNFLIGQNYSELHHHVVPSEAVFRESSRKYRNVVVKLESVAEDTIGSTLLRSAKHHSEISIYQCESCSFQTKHNRSLTTHLLRHNKYEGNLAKHSLKLHENTSEVKMYKCKSCPFQTKRIGTLKEHSFVHQDPSKVTMYQCESCPFQTKCKDSLRKHSLVHKDPSKVTMYKCGSCSFQTKRKGDLKYHLLVHQDPSKVTMYQCESCPFQTKRKGALKSHLLVHKDPPEVTMYQCEACPFLSKRKGDLKNHLLVHQDSSKVTMHQCEYCPYQTKRKGAIKIHSLVHKDPAKVAMYKCESCPYQTQHRDRLKKHSLVHRDPSKITMYQCASCPFQTKRKYGLKNHVLVHMNTSGVTIYQCGSCSFQTKQQFVLDKHSLIHKDSAEVTMYRCELCLFQTKYKDSLKKHSLVHKDPSTLTMYQCELCPFQTKRQCDLNKHSLTHKDSSEVTMYRCKLCQFQTKYKDSLNSHSLVHKDHSTVTMYQCESCSFETKHKMSFERHLSVYKKNHPDIMMYRCDSCAFQTMYKTTLHKHVFTHNSSSDKIVSI